MTLIGKIFSVAILVVSLLFLGVAVMNYVGHRNYKQLVQGRDGLPGVRQRLNEARQNLQQQQEKIERLNNALVLEQAARRSALVVLETRTRELQQQLAAQQQKYDQLAAEHRNQVEELNAAQAEARRLTDAALQLRGDVQQAIAGRDEQFRTVTELTDRLYEGEGALRRLKERSQQLAALRGNSP